MELWVTAIEADGLPEFPNSIRRIRDFLDRLTANKPELVALLEEVLNTFPKEDE